MRRSIRIGVSRGLFYEANTGELDGGFSKITRKGPFSISAVNQPCIGSNTNAEANISDFGILCTSG